MGWREFLKTLFGLGSAGSNEERDIESLRANFKTRLHHFQMLLTANNRALETMAEIEEMLAGTRPIDMGFVRSRYTRVATNVFSIINHLEVISPEKHKGLDTRFRVIQERISILLAHPSADGDAPLVLPLDQADHASIDQVGGKMATLGALKKEPSLRVPEGFVITTEAYRRFMSAGGIQEEIDRLIQSTSVSDERDRMALSGRLKEVIVDAELPAGLSEAILEHIDRLPRPADGELRMAVRSSALGEDTSEQSFAGMYRSDLNVTREGALAAYKRVVASKYNAQAMACRTRKGMRDEEIAMGVGCMPMVVIAAGGVAYSRSPFDDSENAVVIESARGGPSAVMDGTASDRFVVAVVQDRETDGHGPGGATCTIVSSKTKALKRPSLNPEQVEQVARLARQLEALFRGPQDIEWAIDDTGALIVLQCRPLMLQRGNIPSMPPETLPLDVPLRLEGGITASRGQAAGPVFIARREADIAEFESGILVIRQPLPVFATLFDKAQAVICEQGGIAGHLASVARELGVPAIFDLKGATARLHEGDIITVDANHRRIYDGTVHALLERPGLLPKSFVGSSVYRALEEVSKHILPLNLLNPEDPDFKPSACETFHDITRYSHEKAGEAMFTFGVRQPFPGKQSRQLMADVPMQFWLIDLDDGFVPEHEDPRYVRLSEIVSIPMLAVWRGMTAVPWPGPPPINPRGFMEVLVGSTADPALVPSMPSAYATRNYFMISKSYLSLQSRFGYHFCTVEALVGDRVIENFIGFQFKGGAASMERRSRRARMIGEVLTEKGFRTDRHKDVLRARIEGYDRPVMEASLAMVGYLLIHTRQLDMVMSDDAAVRKHKAAILEALETLENVPG
jgi:pyruvate,water dikinase